MKSLLLRGLLITGLILLAGCGSTRPSVFPPQVSIDQLQLSDHGRWELALRIKNDSYAAMTFRQLDGLLQFAGQPPLKLSARLNLEIPALAADVTRIGVPASAAAGKSLIDSSHTPYGLPYRISGQVTASSMQGSDVKHFDFSHDDRFYPVPGDPQRYR